jgi:hypothetical protein
MVTPAFWDSNAATYHESLFGYFGGEIAKQIVRRYNGPATRFLDVCAGTGHMTLAVAAKYPAAKVSPCRR